jgi:hypothetical protein
MSQETGEQSRSLVFGEDGTMVFRKFGVIALASAVLCLATTVSSEAGADGYHTEYLTFSRPVGLPGVTLGSGTYIFELADPNGAHDLVRVFSRDRKTLYLTTYTYPVSRAEVVPGTQFVSFQEAAADGPLPIAVWWSDGLGGRQFVYRVQ